ncbi:MAG: hypothetical protein IPO28_11050 [Holophagaceae bacterium]|nr:hypothetical protein [Holophagaceae bacterium]
MYTQLYANGLQTGQAIRNIVLDPSNPKAFQNYDAALKEFAATLQRGIALTADTPERQKTLREVGAQWEALARLQEPIKDKTLDQAAAITLLNKQATPAWRAIKDRLLGLMKQQEGGQDTSRRPGSTGTQTNSMRLALGVGLRGRRPGTAALPSWPSGTRSGAWGTSGAPWATWAKRQGRLPRRLPIEGQDEIADTPIRPTS